MYLVMAECSELQIGQGDYCMENFAVIPFGTIYFAVLCYFTLGGF